MHDLHGGALPVSSQEKVSAEEIKPKEEARRIADRELTNLGYARAYGRLEDGDEGSRFEQWLHDTERRIAFDGGAGGGPWCDTRGCPKRWNPTASHAGLGDAYSLGNLVPHSSS